jgi:hypothetical protein
LRNVHNSIVQMRQGLYSIAAGDFTLCVKGTGRIRLGVGRMVA